MEIAKLRLANEPYGTLQEVLGVLLHVLALLGVGVSLYKLLAPEGWASQLFGRSIAGGIATVLTAVMIGASLWLTREFVPQRSRDRVTAVLLALLAGMGAFHAIQFCIKGGL